ncbi:hypothetical protein [Thauera linaloolentis]|uniref:YD repeat-containing protein n=1 Tax=Thauera linaloolentis (strain DSM 12138 / JCM 21573 / CCUG 41526 / CIP 105981 / IAM 15112 / NBRC 102519 / 47Lol) TaxID=1123367 RepID=N6Y5M3_THAL4|nr:hypothetical protein [Thauera linaloolentis]ENO89506.1 hypothetical protein C666_05620 [Thauera linaloolentis 47Lol = DSM 12138]MCM8565401.1 hypothetical protein [Thauera linaloolentis]
MKLEKQGFAAILLMPLVAMAGVALQSGDALPVLHAAGEPRLRAQTFVRTEVEAVTVPGTGTVTVEEGRSGRVICDERGRIVRKIDAAGHVTELIHHPHTGKLILILDQRLGTALVYHYDDDGKLIRAQDANGRQFRFDYGRTASVQRLVVTGGEGVPRRELAFKYGPHGKPVEIRLAGVGRIDMEYDRDGEISRVSSSKGAELTLQVMETFRHFLAVVRAAQTGIE